MTLNYNSPSSIGAYLAEHSIAMQKKFGQNFLIEENARKKIAAELQAREGCAVFEIGAGLGSITKELLKNGNKVFISEIDIGFISALKNIFQKEIETEKLIVLEGDILKIEIPNTKYIIGNLPYNIAHAVIAKIIKCGVINKSNIERMIFTVQKEEGERLLAKPRDKNYCALSVFCALFFEIKVLCKMPASFFYPAPRVESVTLVFEARNNAPPPLVFFSLVESLFSKRRKSVYNNLREFLNDSGKAEGALKESGVSPTARAEELTPKNFLNIARFVV